MIRTGLQAGVLVVVTAAFLGGGIFAATHVSNSIDLVIAEATTARMQAAAAGSILSAAKDAETGQRGYLLTGRPAYLEPYHTAMAQIDRRIDRLVVLSRGTDWLEPEAANLAATARAKAAELQHTLEVANREGFPAAIAIVNGETGRVYMDEIRTLADRIVAHAEAERASRAATLRDRLQLVTTLLLTGLGTGVVLLGAAALALLLNRLKLLRARAGERREALRLAAAVEHMPDGVAVFGADMRLVLANDRLAPSLGIAPELARSGARLDEIAAAAGLVPAVLDGPRPGEPRAAEARQAERTLVIWRSPMPDGGQMVAVADLTRRVAAEEEARQSQKMDVLGQMTGGVAHDFNNLLQVVSANLELLRNRLVRAGVEAALLARLDAASAGVARGAKLTRHLLAFARRQPLAPEPLDPARQLRAMEEMLRRTVGEGVALELVVGGGVWAMRADPTQFENAILNLALNARDAMEGTDGVAAGNLTIEVSNAALDEDYAARAAEVTPGQYVMFAVTDTGVGMSAAQQDRAVEPFYTTKPEGRGTGLGLPMVLGFAKQSGGHFQLYSEPGRGSTARIYIPRTTAAASRVEAVSVGVPVGTGDLVLLVEDDTAVRQVAREALLSLNYQVVEAENADAALALVRAGCQPRLLFTDVVMPGRLSARAMARQAVALVPGLKVLFTSGYTQNSIVHNGQLDEDVALISKPWRQEDLARAVRAALDGSGGRPAPLRRALLVEAEPLLRATTADALAGLGFEVVEAMSAEAALARMKPAPDLLLVDTGVDWEQVAAAVRVAAPGVRVVLSSSRSERPEGEQGWLPKPYDIPALRAAVERAFD